MSCFRYIDHIRLWIGRLEGYDRFIVEQMHLVYVLVAWVCFVAGVVCGGIGVMIWQMYLR